MRDDIAEYSALTWNSEINTGVESQKALVTLQARILMRMNPDDIDYPKLQSALATPVADQNEGRKALAIVARGILKREWERFKADLEDIEVSPQ